MDGSKVVIVIPFLHWMDWVLECVAGCQRQAVAADVTICLIPDTAPPDAWQRKIEQAGSRWPVEIIASGPGNPATKRNRAMEAHPEANFYALVDSDAWPDDGWLANALKRFDGAPELGIVAGPNLTPPNDPLLRRVCGRVMESPLGFGGGYVRHTPVAEHEPQEMPTCNMITRNIPTVRFREHMDTAEDMLYCHDMRNAGYRLLYVPEVRVFHHRRTFPGPFARQFRAYGQDKGRLAITSREAIHVWHAIPALLALYLVFAGAILWWLPPALRALGVIPLVLYVATVLIESLRRTRNLPEFLLTLAAFPAAHLAYGSGYLKGLASRVSKTS